ncbi:MAG: hypothetical protein HRT54_22080 [Colwellia sp.]|nr:hypothetical protein [Colwellia sp.]
MLELIKYLNDNFFTKQELLNVTKIQQQTLLDYQELKVMPKCSYKLNIDLQSDSVFGLYNEEQEIEYYAKGYASWLATIESIKPPETGYSVFSERYKVAINTLKEDGYTTSSSKVTTELNQHIKEEWSHFINGVYGLCTKSGLPEDIAAKELAVIIITELSEINELSADEMTKLTSAVNLLDKASSLFAPHERLRSSRHRLVNETRRKYMLNS